MTGEKGVKTNNILEKADGLRAQTLAVLRLLVENRGAVVSKEEIHRNVWGGSKVRDDSIVQCISEIRKFLRKNSNLTVDTLPRRGYLLKDPTGMSTAKRDEQSLPTIAIMPFDSSRRMNDLDFARGLTGSIISELAKHKDIFVIAHHSVLSYAANLPPVEQIARDLQVRYLVRGSIQIGRTEVRVTAQLTDSSRSICVWSDSFTHPLSDLFEMQDSLGASIANRIGGSAGIVIASERARLEKRNPVDMNAYDFYVAGSNLDNYFSKDGSASAIKLYRQAVDRDPNFGRAWSRLASIYLCRLAYTYDSDFEEAASNFVYAALKSVELDPNDPINFALGGAANFTLGNVDQGHSMIQRALDLGPNDADTLAVIAYVRPTKRANSEEDFDHIQRAMKLNPFYPDWYLLALGYCAFHTRHYQESVDALSKSNDSFLDKHLYLALGYAQLGDTAHSNKHRKALLEIKPDLSTDELCRADSMCDEAEKHFKQSARKAKLPK